MKTSIIRLFFLFSCFGLNNVSVAQTKFESKGSQKFNNYDYFDAIENLEVIKNRSADVNRTLAKSYDQLGDFKNAELCYSAVVYSTSRVPSDVLEYARVLLKNQNYAEAERQFEEYKKLNPYDKQTEQFSQLAFQLEQFSKNSDNVKLVNLAINSPEEDFAPVVLFNQLYFASSRTKRTLVRRSWNGNKKSFLDLYNTNISGETAESPKRIDGKSINKKYHEGPVSFSSTGDQMYLTRNNYSGKGRDGSVNLKLLISKFEGNTWTSPQELPFNSNDFSVGHATVSHDGNTMIFVSDMPGGKGGADLYVSYLVGGDWTVPVNLTKLNTTGDEVFPFFHESGGLLFASNGHLGYGGLDIFITQWKRDEGAGRIMNLGAPINSAYDDFSIWLSSDKLSGYFASNRKDGKGDDDLYTFTLDKTIEFGRLIQGIAKDRNGKPLSNALVEVLNDKGEVVAKSNTNDDGSYQLTTSDEGNMSLVFSRENFYELKVPFQFGPQSPDAFEYNVALENDPGFSLQFSLIDVTTKTPLDNVRLIITDNITGKQEVVFTDLYGKSRRPIINKKIGDQINYSFQFERDGFITKTVNYNRVLDRAGVYDISEELNTGMAKKIVGSNVAVAVDIENIYFDLNKYNIRPDAALELNKIVKIMNENPTMKIELGSHTDCRGSAQSNMILSQKRAEASAAYIKAKITNPDRIFGKGYGEYKILNGCICEGGKSPVYPEAEHALNRRTEFLIVQN